MRVSALGANWLDNGTAVAELVVCADGDMCAVVHCGHTNGVVTMWSPNMSAPVVKQLCHRGPVNGPPISTPLMPDAPSR